MRCVVKVEQLLSNQEYALDGSRRAALSSASPEAAEDALKKHEAFVAGMAAADDRVDALLKEAKVLCEPEVRHHAAERIQEKADKIDKRRNQNKDDAQAVAVLLRVIGVCARLNGLGGFSTVSSSGLRFFSAID